MEAQETLSSPPLAEKIQDKSFLEEHLLAELVILTWIISLWDWYLTIRQRRLMQKLAQPPAVLDNILSAEVYHKSRTYALDKNTFGMVHEMYSDILNTVFMIYWGFYYFWEWGKDFVEFFGLDSSNELYATAGFLTVSRIYSTLICELPFTIYSTFVLEAKHDFNNQTVLFFIKDQILKFIVSHFLMVPLTCAAVWIIQNGGDYFFLYLWGFTIVMSLLLMVIYPEFIAPLFDKYTPLPEGDLRTRIEELASSLGFPLYKLYIVEGSKRSSHSNAYLYGFHKHKRIVLFDTLVAEYQQKKLEEEEKERESKAAQEGGEGEKKEADKKPKEARGCETDEIIAVLAHELGHWHHSHTIKGYVYGQVIVLTNLYLFAQLLNYAPIYEAFGFTNSKPILIGLTIVMSHVLAPVNKLLGWLMTINSRIFEFQADEFAMKLGHAEPLKRALVKLHKDNLGYPIFDKLYSNWHHSHPPLLERLDALKKSD